MKLKHSLLKTCLTIATLSCLVNCSSATVKDREAELFELPKLSSVVDESIAQYILSQAQSNISLVKKSEEYYKEARNYKDYYEISGFKTGTTQLSTKAHDIADDGPINEVESEREITYFYDNQVMVNETIYIGKSELGGSKYQAEASYGELRFPMKNPTEDIPDNYSLITMESGIQLSGKIEYDFDAMTPNMQETNFANNDEELANAWISYCLGRIDYNCEDAPMYIDEDGNYIVYSYTIEKSTSSHPFYDYTFDSKLPFTSKITRVTKFDYIENHGFVITASGNKEEIYLDVDLNGNKLKQSLLVEEEIEAAYYSFDSLGEFDFKKPADIGNLSGNIDYTFAIAKPDLNGINDDTYSDSLYVDEEFLQFDAELNKYVRKGTKKVYLNSDDVYYFVRVKRVYTPNVGDTYEYTKYGYDYLNVDHSCIVNEGSVINEIVSFTVPVSGNYYFQVTCDVDYSLINFSIGIDISGLNM